MVLPDTFSGDGPFDEWIDHFESVAQVNRRWSGEDLAVWLRVLLTGRAQTAYKRLDTDTRNSYEAVKETLKSRFEPESKRGLYAAEFAARSRKPAESFGEDLKCLADLSGSTRRSKREAVGRSLRE